MLFYLSIYGYKTRHMLCYCFVVLHLDHSSSAHVFNCYFKINKLDLLYFPCFTKYKTEFHSCFRYVALNMLMKAITVDAQAVQRHRATILECVKVWGCTILISFYVWTTGSYRESYKFYNLHKSYLLYMQNIIFLV